MKTGNALNYIKKDFLKKVKILDFKICKHFNFSFSNWHLGFKIEQF